MQQLQSNDQMTMPSLKERQTAVEYLLDQLVANQRLGYEEVAMIKELVMEQNAVIGVLQDENFQMKERLPKVQPLHEELLTYKQEASDYITALQVQLNGTKLKIIDLEEKLTQFGVEIVQLETSKSKEIQELNCQWKEKLQNAEDQSKRIIDEIVRKHCELKKGYEGVIYGLKEQVAHKEAEVAWCQLMMKERDNNIEREIANLKKELNVTSQKNQELLEQRVLEVEKRANKMTRKYLKLQQDYEHKITTLKKEKELQIQVLQRQMQLVGDRDMTEQELRVTKAVRELEMRYRKIIVSLHTSTQQQRQQDMQRIATLESIVKPSTITSDMCRQ